MTNGGDEKKKKRVRNLQCSAAQCSTVQCSADKHFEKLSKITTEWRIEAKFNQLTQNYRFIFVT